MDTEIETPESHPNHHTVGRFFKSSASVYYCTSYDPRNGFWMENVSDPLDRRNVSERAIGSTFQPLYSFDKALTEAEANWEKTHQVGVCAHCAIQAHSYSCRYCQHCGSCCACGV